MLKLRLLTGPRAGRQLRVSDTKPVSIGRRKGRLRLHDSRVSKNHAEIYYDNGLWLLRDLGSANGTFVNRKRVKGMIELEPGDQIQMGRVLLKIVRCDMIGMDTQAFKPDEPSEAKVSALAPPDIKTDPTADEDDFDLEDLFGDSEENEDDLNEASAAFDAIAAIDAPAEVSDVQIDVEEIELADQAVPEPVEIEFDEPVDDDDSFFADIGESTDATNGDAVSLVDDDDDFSSADDAVDHAQDESHAPIELAGEETPKAVADDRPIESHEEPDPFLSAEPEPEEESTGDDLISLDDESGGGPRSAGTTLLTAAHDDGTPIDTAEHSDGVSLDEAEDEDDDADDEPPALVGLALEHTPPQQPVATDEEALAQDIAADDVEDEITSDESAELDELDEPDESIELTEVEEPLAPAVEVIAELDAEPIAEEIVEDLNLEPEAAADVELEEPTFEIDEIEIDETAFEISDADQLSDSALFDALDLEDDPEPIVTAKQAEASDDIDEPFSEIDLPPGIPSPQLDALDDIDEDELIGESDEDVFAERGDEDEQTSEESPENEPAVSAEVLEGLLDEDDQEADSEFDIDAAFDALSAGLDDTVAGLPAIDEALAEEAADSLDASVPDVAEQADRTDTSEQPTDSETDALIGSQLDVSFIQDALSKLEEDQPDGTSSQEDNEPPKASLSPAASHTTELPTQAPPQPEPPSNPYLQSAPPGLNTSGMNPTTTLPPSESTRPITPNQSGGGAGRWLIILLLFVGIVGVGGYLISQNYDRLVGNRTNPASNDTTQNNGPIALDNTPSGPTDPTNQPDNADGTAPVERDGPNPFSSGPPVLGGDALQGLFRDSSDSRPLDLPKQPTIDTDTNPDPISNPNRPTVGNTGPDLQNPDQPNPPTDPTPTVTPVVDEKPARIVFLVDASGSLVDSLPQMLAWLNEALRTVKENEEFAVYFFKSDKPIAIKPEGMLKPSRALLAKVSEDWLSSDKMPVFPSGRSNPTQAIAQALTLNPTDIYLLSDDAFAFSQGDTKPGEALTLVKEAIGDAKVRVHGVQFFYRSEQNILETLANQYDGTYEFVRERVVPNADPIDLLEELGNE